MMESSRRATKTLFVVAGLYVAIGLVVAASAAFAGDRLSTFLGFLIISGALALGVLMQAILRLTTRLSGLGDRLDLVHDRLYQIERRIDRFESRGSPAEPEISARTIDLSTAGCGDPGVLTAATLDRSRFPRLVTVMEHAPVPMDDMGQAKAVRPGPMAFPVDGPGEPQPAFDEVQAIHEQTMAPVITRNLLREWRVGLRDGDLAACRRIFSALVDTADTSTVLPLSAQLQELTERTEQRLRAEFSAAVRAREFAAALRVGAQMSELMPGHALADEFEKLRPHLLRKLTSEIPLAAHR